MRIFLYVWMLTASMSFAVGENNLVFAGTHDYLRQPFLADALHIPPQADYQKFTSAHFEILFPANFEEEAKEAAVYLEEAHSLLSKEFNYEASHRVSVIIADSQDMANGVTAVFGHQGLVLFLTAPDPYSSIGEYENWLRGLIIHEYAHYLSLEQRRGIYSAIKVLLGNSVFPNQLWPTWLAEGMAVYSETKFTERGRGRGDYYTTLTRDALRRGTLGKSDFLSFDKISGPYPKPPFGEGYYFLGYGIMDQMTRELGPDALSRFANESSWRLPYFLNGALENIGGDRFRGLWSRFIDYELKRLKPELDWLSQYGSPDPKLVTPAGVNVTGSRLSGDWLAYTIAQTPHDLPSVRVRNLKSEKEWKVSTSISGAGLAFGKRDGQDVLYYTQFGYDGPFHLYSDLYVYDLENKTSTRLTTGERAKDPDFCSTGEIVFSHREGMQSEIRKLSKDGAIQTLYRAENHHHVMSPRCSPDGKKIYFSLHDTQPFETLMVMENAPEAAPENLAGGKGSGFRALFPEPTADGKSVYFVRAQNRFFELARLDLKTKKIALVARSSGGYWLPSISGDTMAVTYLTAQGNRVGLFQPAAAESLMHLVPTLPSEEAEKPTRAFASEKKVLDLEKSSYRFYSSLLPRVWSPYLLLEEDHLAIGATLQGWDTLDQVTYNLTAYYDSILKRPAGEITIHNRLGTFTLEPYFSTEMTAYVMTETGRIYAEDRVGGIRISRPFPGVFSRFVPTFIYQWGKTYIGGDYGSYDYPADHQLGAQLVYDARNSVAYSLTPERGFMAMANMRGFYALNTTAYKAWLQWNQLLPFWWPKHSNISANMISVFAPKVHPYFYHSYVRLGGDGDAGELEPPLRGYSDSAFIGKRAHVMQAEFRFPIAQLFWGYDTLPVFIKNFGGFAFYDVGTYANEASEYQSFRGGVGGGGIFNLTFGYHAPVQLKVEYSHGLKKEYGGQDSVVVKLGM